MQISNEVLATMISGMFAVTVALIQRVSVHVRRQSAKIDGLKNGHRAQALAVIEELRRERTVLELQGLAPHRRVDTMIQEVHGEPDPA